MAVTLIETLGAPNANSYASLADAEAYFNERLFADAWIAVSVSDVKRQALITAFNRIEEEEFLGRKASAAQRSHWPAVDCYDDPCESYVVADVLNGLAIPREVIESQFELALALLTGKKDAAAPNALAQFQSLSLPGGLSLVMAENLAKFGDEGLPAVCNRKLMHFRPAVGYTRINRS